MSTTQQSSNQHWTAEQLRRLSPADRDHILSAAAEQAEAEYRTDESLTDFEAFGEEDLHGDSANAEPR